MRRPLKPSTENVEATNLREIELQKEFVVSDYKFGFSQTFACDFITLKINGEMYYTTAQAVVQEFKRIDDIIAKAEDKALTLIAKFEMRKSAKNNKDYLIVEIVVDAPDNSDIWRVDEANEMFADLGNLEL